MPFSTKSKSLTKKSKPLSLSKNLMKRLISQPYHTDIPCLNHEIDLSFFRRTILASFKIISKFPFLKTAKHYRIVEQGYSVHAIVDDDGKTTAHIDNIDPRYDLLGHVSKDAPEWLYAFVVLFFNFYIILFQFRLISNFRLDMISIALVMTILSIALSIIILEYNYPKKQINEINRITDTKKVGLGYWIDYYIHRIVKFVRNC